MIEESKNEVAEIKGYSWESISINFWILKRNLRKGKAKYSVKTLELEGFEQNFKDLAKKHLDRIETISEYQHISVDLDESGILVACGEETDFSSILKEVLKGSDQAGIGELKDLNNTWAYIIEFTFEDKKFYGFTKIKSGWNIKQKPGIINAIFKDGKFINQESSPTFPLRQSFDFIYSNDILLIFNKTNFELGLNIREGLVQERDALISEMVDMSIIGDQEQFTNLIGNNKHYLRKACLAKQHEYYKDMDYLNKMETVISNNGWGIERDGTKFILNESNIETFLTLLNNGRLKSPINDELFDTDVKVKVKS